MKSIFVALVIFVVGINAFAILEDDIHSQWQQFKTKHARSYSVSEDLKRKAIFSQNVEKISSHNKLYDEGKTSFKLGVNAFTDMTEEEYKKRLGFRAPRKAGSKNLGLVYDDTVVIVNITGPANGTLPSQVDWRTSGAVTGVKDQGACGSCWAFSATGALEGQYFLKNNKNASLSEKNLVDCSHESINIGCGGGDMVGAFQYVHNNDGIDDEDHYPYSPTDGECLYDPDYNVTSTSIVVLMAQLGNEDALKFLVSLYGPIAVAIDAGHASFQLYASGVYYEANCISAEEDPLGLLDHGVLLVGYGTDASGNDYWLVKNSWGYVWGDDGYIKMARNRNNNCGISSYASVPLPYLN